MAWTEIAEVVGRSFVRHRVSGNWYRCTLLRGHDQSGNPADGIRRANVYCKPSIRGDRARPYLKLRSVPMRGYYKATLQWRQIGIVHGGFSAVEGFLIDYGGY